MGGYAHALGARLRTIRVEQGMTLNRVEQKSKGRWLAGVVSSYESGDGAVTVQCLVDLAGFYGVSVLDMLPELQPVTSVEAAPSVVLDLQRLAELPAAQVGPVARYAAAIQRQRGGCSGDFLSIRLEDLRSLAMIYGVSREAVTDMLSAWGVLGPQYPRHPDAVRPEVTPAL